ncbi:MAG: 50S ribosomal protein L28 [Candidatus Margulisbacteria bacterium]|jgi:large subunit ribosomal protein L28|nr:50S ribosomal protein L28 [Candidatus Margulisiibacteriota bacterium]
MSRKCFICDKKPVVGNSVSHSNRKTKRRWLPNLQKVQILVKGKKLKEYVCTKCLKAGKVTKALSRA